MAKQLIRILLILLATQLLNNISLIVGADLHISPLTPVEINDNNIAAISAVPSNQFYIDVQGLGDGRDFYDNEALSIQVVDGGPVWTFYRKFGSSLDNENFAGETLDGGATCSLLRRISQPSSSDGQTFEILTGLIQDLNEGLWYELKPNAESKNTVTVVRDEEVPESADPDPTEVPELQLDIYQNDDESKIGFVLLQSWRNKYFQWNRISNEVSVGSLLPGPRKLKGVTKIRRGLENEGRKGVKKDDDDDDDDVPSASPTVSLSPSFSSSPSTSPTVSAMPSISISPSVFPSNAPSYVPSAVPSQSSAPSEMPSLGPSMSVEPSSFPSAFPSESAFPSNFPSVVPSVSVQPSLSPSTMPSQSSFPSNLPSFAPTKSMEPSLSPTAMPSMVPSSAPSIAPTPLVYTIVDVMVIWTNAAECVKSNIAPGCTLTSVTEANMRAAVDLLVAEANVAYKQSHINLKVNLVHAQRHSEFGEGGLLAFPRALAHVSTSQTVKDLRFLYNADLVLFLIDNSGSPNIAGMAYNLYETPDKQGWMFSVVASQFSSIKYVPSHEWGHNFGCFHDRGTENACEDKSKASYGYRDKDAAFATIMAYDCKRECDNLNMSGSCPRIQYFSGNATYQGKSLGGTENNCRDRIMATKDIVAAAVGDGAVEEDCFPPTARVIVEGKGHVEMKDLVVGDRVLTPSGTYKSVFMRDHFHPSKVTNYLQIHTTIQEERPLEVSLHHMVFVQQDVVPIPASEVKIGDTLQSHSGPVTVIKIVPVLREGLYNYLTEDGTMIVDDIVVSTYAALWGKAYIELGSWKVISYQSFYNLLLRPYHRLLKYLGTSLVQRMTPNTANDSQNEYDGLVWIGKELITSWSRQHMLTRVCSLGFVLVLFGCLNMLLSFHPLLLTALGGLILLLRKQRRNHYYKG